MDIPALCPALSFSQPWSVPPGFVLDQSIREREEQKQLVLNESVWEKEHKKQVVILEVNNVSLSVSQFDLPRPKEEAPKLTGKNKTRCSQRYAAAHCGPVAVRYGRVGLEWDGGVLGVEGEGIVVQQGDRSAVYRWGEVARIDLGVTGELEVFTDVMET